MKNSLLFLVITVIAIVGGAGLFYFGSKLSDNELINQSVNTQLLRLETLDSNINELALRSRANLDGNYDMLVRSTVAMERTVFDLSDSFFEKSVIARSLLDRRFDTFTTAIEIKVDQLESFKSSNAVLRNSEKYIPLAGLQLTKIAEQNGLEEVSDLYKQIVIDMLEFTKQGSNRQVQDVVDYRARIIESEALMPAENSIMVLEFANHVTTAIDSKQQTDAYLWRVLNSSTDEQIGGISEAWNLWQSQQNNTQEILRYYILVYVLVMLSMIGRLVYRLRKVYKTLDQEVEAKTQEIKAAYEDLQSSERKLVQTEKMASLGQLVAGVAHGINTPLSYITSNLETIKARYQQLVPVLVTAGEISEQASNPGRDKSVINSLLKQQVAATRRVSKNNDPVNMDLLIGDATGGLLAIKEIVDSLTNYSHVQDAPLQTVDVNEGINHCLNVMAKTIGQSKLKLHLAIDLPEVKGVPNQLAQVYTNIINNAIHAIDAKSGKLLIRTEAAADGVKITFKDNGRGIDDASLKRVFEPFFTTKEVGEGTGLGLSISQQIIAAHDGEMTIDSKVGSGTTVIVRLPIAADV